MSKVPLGSPISEELQPKPSTITEKSTIANLIEPLDNMIVACTAIETIMAEMKIPIQHTPSKGPSEGPRKMPSEQFGNQEQSRNQEQFGNQEQVQQKGILRGIASSALQNVGRIGTGVQGTLGFAKDVTLGAVTGTAALAASPYMALNAAHKRKMIGGAKTRRIYKKNKKDTKDTKKKKKL